MPLRAPEGFVPFQTYRPESFCREFVEIRGNSMQLTLFMALVLGLKPLMDDWVPRSRLPEYLAMLERYGLHHRIECLKVILPRERVAAAVGADTLTSTIALGLPPDADLEGVVHIFLSRDRSLLKHGMWYPVIVKGRVIWPPHADVLKYGRYLGYPPCCVTFFRQWNDWTRYSFLAEIHRNSEGARPHLLCNPLTKDATYSYIYHMPCRWDCPATVQRASRLRAELLEREPELVRRIDWHLSLPALVFYERKHFVFEGTLHGRRLEYSAVHYPDGMPEGWEPHSRLAQGDSLELAGTTVRIYRGSELIDEIPARREGFAPERPFLVQFTFPG